MNKHFLRALLAALTLALLLTACGQKRDTADDIPTGPPSAGEAPADDTAAAAALRAVLLGKSMFRDTDRDELLDLAALSQRLDSEAGTKEPELSTAPQEFTVSRFGGDTLCAVVSLGGAHDSCRGYLLLHWYGGTIYGESSLSTRDLSQLKSDGGYPWMLGGADYGWSRLAFADGRLLPSPYLYSQQRPESTDYDPVYYLRAGKTDEEISEDTFTALYAAEDAGPDARWHALTAENVDAALTAALAAPTEAQAHSLYTAFFCSETSASATLINSGTPSAESAFRAPDIYAAKGVDGSDTDWTIDRFALLDMDGDGISEPVLAINLSGEEEYVILTCYDGAVHASQVVYRGFLVPKAGGTFEWSNGAFDNGASRARFENGVLIYEDFASMSGSSDGSVIYTLNGESVDETAYSAFLDEQSAKDDLAWTAFSIDAIAEALAG